MVNKPEEVGLPSAEEKEDEQAQRIASGEAEEVKSNLWSALRIPGSDFKHDFGIPFEYYIRHHEFHAHIWF